MVEILLADEDRKEGDRSDVDDDPSDLNAKVHADLVFGVETECQYRPREVVKRHRVAVSEDSWEQLQRIWSDRNVDNNPEDEEERDEFGGDQDDHRVQCESERKHGDPSHHPVD